MRFLLGFAVAAFMVFSPPMLSAADGGPLKIAVLDVEKVRRDATAVQSIRAQLGTYVDSYRNDAQKEEADLITAQDELSRKRTVLSPESFAEERKKLEQRLAEAQGKVQDRRRSLERVHAEALQKVQQVLGDIVNDISRDRQYTIVLRKDQTVYIASGLEITDEVLKRLDAKLPSVEISSPN